MSRKGLPQASAAVCWSVTGSSSQPTGTETTLWSVSLSDPHGWEKSARHIFFYYSYVRYTPDRCLQSLRPKWIGVSLIICLSDQQLISAALQHDSGLIFIGGSIYVFSSIVPISF